MCNFLSNDKKLFLSTGPVQILAVSLYTKSKIRVWKDNVATVYGAGSNTPIVELMEVAPVKVEPR